MQALQRGSARLAPRRVRCVRTDQRFSSSHTASGWNPTHGVNEPIGTTFWIIMGILPAGCIINIASRRGPEGELPWISTLLQRDPKLDELWAERNATRSAALRQAADDRLLFNSAPTPTHYEIRMPESIHSHSRRNIRPGQLINLDAVTEKYRQQHLDMEEKKVRRRAVNEEMDRLKK